MTPAWRVRADSKDVTVAIAQRLVSLTLTDKPGLESDELTLTISDHDGAVALPRRGVVLQLALGWQGEALIDKGRYKVDEVSHAGPPDVITIKARSADFTSALKCQRDLSYDKTTLGDVLRAIGERNGLHSAVDSGLAALAIMHIDQTNESDANFLTRLGERYDAAATIKDGRLLFIPRGSGTAASGAMLPTAVIHRTETDSHDFTEADREGSVSGVQAQWRDLDGAKTKKALAGSEESAKTLKRIYPSEAEAQAAAAAEWSAVQRAQQTLRLSLARGRADIIAGQTFRVAGFRPAIDAVQWWVHEITHTVDGSTGYTSSLSAESAAPEES